MNDKKPFTLSVIFIGISSFLFHYIPTKLFSILDVFSIFLFVILYNTLLTRNILKYSISLFNIIFYFINFIIFFIRNFIFKNYSKHFIFLFRLTIIYAIYFIFNKKVEKHKIFFTCYYIICFIYYF